jgi:hypothetical protein
MSLEYAIEYICEMRRRYDETTIRALGRTGALVSRFVSETLQREGAPTSDGIAFTTHFSPEVERAEEIANFCRANCPAHLDEDQVGSPREAIGCLGRVNYPLDARFEHFLADRLQLLYDTRDPADWPRLLHLLIDPESPFDGEGTKDLRRVTTDEGLRFFELRLPIQLTRQAQRLTTDNVFDLLAGFAASDDGASGYQREFPVVALGDFGDFLEALLIADLDDGERERIEAQSASYGQYVRLTRAVRRAEQLRVRLLLD